MLHSRSTPGGRAPRARAKAPGRHRLAPLASLRTPASADKANRWPVCTRGLQPPGRRLRSPRMGLPSTTLTRTSAIVSLGALALVSVSDFVVTGFWDRNTMATSVIADLLVLVVGVAVVNEFLSARAQREGRLLSDYGLVELGEVARHTWVMLAQHIGVGQRESLTLNEFRELVRSSEGEATVRELALALASDDSRRRSFHDLVADLADTARVRRGRAGASPPPTGRGPAGGRRCSSRLRFRTRPRDSCGYRCG